MDDKELIEYAAKAIGINLEWDGNPKEWTPMYYAGKTYHSFNPLTDDGDAFRLQTKLHMIVEVDYYSAIANGLIESVTMGDLIEEATRRAIVRAAAQIGKAIP